jgi:putative hydrolase of the HAD superfamily
MEKIKLSKEIKNKKVILLDMDDTIYEYKPCHDFALEKVYEIYKKKRKSISYNSFLLKYENAKKEVKKLTKNQGASHSRFLYFQYMLENESKKTIFSETHLLSKIYWDSFIKKMTLNKWVIPFLKNCKKNHKKVVIVTDLTSEVQFRKIIKLGIKNYIDFIVTSEEAGIEKPSNIIFKLALSKIGEKEKAAIIIGDSYSKDKSSHIRSIILKDKIVVV